MKTAPQPFPEILHFDNAGMRGGKRIICVTRPFPVVTSLGCFTVHAGFLSDGASIPPLAQAIAGHPFDACLEPAIAHDWLYSRHSDRMAFERRDADFILKELMWNWHLPKWKAPLFHAAVTLGGWKYYKKS
jgi:hypothetical protein